MELLQVNRNKGCGMCGSKLVFIRGKYPKTKKRKICPTCAYERLEQINEISGPNYGRACQNIDSIKTKSTIQNPSLQGG